MDNAVWTILWVDFHMIWWKDWILWGLPQLNPWCFDMLGLLLSLQCNLPQLMVLWNAVHIVWFFNKKEEWKWLAFYWQWQLFDIFAKRLFKRSRVFQDSNKRIHNMAQKRSTSFFLHYWIKPLASAIQYRLWSIHDYLVTFYCVFPIAIMLISRNSYIFSSSTAIVNIPPNNEMKHEDSSTLVKNLPRSTPSINWNSSCGLFVCCVSSSHVIKLWWNKIKW